MTENETTCFKVSDTEICANFKSRNIIKNGFTKSRKQQYYCKGCSKRSIDFYTYNSYQVKDKTIIQLTREGLGIRSTARVLKISSTTLLKRIIIIARGIPIQPIPNGKIYEVDEMRSFVRNKENQTWIVHALERKTKKVVSFAIGRRTKSTLQKVINSLLLSEPKAIYTDGLRIINH